MTTSLWTHPLCLEHLAGLNHPEQPARLRGVLQRLRAPEFADVIWREAPPASYEQLVRVHAASYVEKALAAAPAEGVVALDYDTYLTPQSGQAALYAAGAVCAAVDAVVMEEGHRAFCAIRPPGHHAEHDRAMGFCLFNNALVGAQQARVHHGIERVAIIDFDVHHGNGTQHSVERDLAIFYGSTHQAPLYPGTGAEEEIGLGNICNIPLAPGSGSDAFRRAVEERLLGELAAFQPQFLILSAGFDAHYADPLAELRLEEADFAWITRCMVDIAQRFCKGRIVSVMEGGYNLEALANSVAAHLEALMHP